MNELARSMPWPERCDRAAQEAREDVPLETLPESLLTREWLISNGLGGYASGTLAGVPTRRYHGLLVAAMPAPVGRTFMLGPIEEGLRLPGGTILRPGGGAGGLRPGCRPSPGVPPGVGAAGVDLRGERLPPAEAGLPRPSPEHRPRPLPAGDGGRAGAPRAPPHGPLPPPRRAGVDAARRRLPPDRGGQPLRALLAVAEPAVAAPGDRGGAPVLHRRRAEDRGRPLRRRGAPRLRV